MPGKIAQRVVEATLNVTPNLPASFDGHPWLYAMALNSLTLIALLGIAICGWMMRDTWQDRYIVHPLSLLFGFRIMFMIIGFVAFLRCLPEVIYLQAYGEKNVSSELISIILLGKRLADTVSVFAVLMWMLIFVTVYPFVCLALKYGAAGKVRVDFPSMWFRLRRPCVLFIVVSCMSLLMAYSKVYGG